MKNCIPNYWEREREWGISFPTFGNGNGNEKTIPSFREREWEASIPGNGREREFPLTPVARGKLNFHNIQSCDEKGQESESADRSEILNHTLSAQSQNEIKYLCWR